MTVPTLLDRYELGPSLGGGRGSTTHLATLRASSEPCVIKSLSVGAVVRDSGGTHSLDADDFTKLIELFEREARVLAHLDHPGIPRFIDHFTEEVEGDTRLYTVQEFVAGKTLQALIDEGKHFTEAEAKDLCRQIAEILLYLHGRSPPLIHRDIKPTNVILGDEGTVHLVDFGSVRDSIGGDGLDGKTIVGTYGYMPVEQYEARAVPQSDFYALGMTLVAVLSHREPTKIPRDGMTLEFRPHVNVSEGFATTLERMIQAAPGDRHDSAEELLADLARPSHGGGSKRERGRRTGGTKKTRWAAAAFAALAALGGLTLGTGMWVSSSDGGFESGGLGVRVPFGPGAAPQPVRAASGVLSIDVDRDFRYVPEGFPMGRVAGQSELPPLTSVPAEELLVPPDLMTSGAVIYYGYFPLGNGEDDRISFALARRGGPWILFVDLNNNEDLTDDGPPSQNQGTGPVFATNIFLRVDVVDTRGATRVRPYHLWTWFDEAGRGMRGRFYAVNHYAGSILAGDVQYQATAFEDTRHDVLYRESGLCIDVDRNADCDEDREIYFDGDVIELPGGPFRLALTYP